METAEQRMEHVLAIGVIVNRLILKHCTSVKENSKQNPVTDHDHILLICTKQMITGFPIFFNSSAVEIKATGLQ
jgi:hypothetical protein